MSASQAAAIEDQEALFQRATPQGGYFTRMGRILRLSLRLRTLNLLAGIPGLGGLAKQSNQPRLMPLSSEAGFMANWYHKAYGTPEKPDFLQEMPWDYLEAHQEEVPFFGLRNYWYPALLSDELKHNKVKAVQMLGDSIVLFRGADGEIGALENRCPHRSVLLSLGQCNVWEIGTLTCRYHGATFNAKGECVAFLSDGANSRACGQERYQVRSYPAYERNGVIYLWMGDGEPEDIMTNLPRSETLNEGYAFALNSVVPYSYLNLVDNATDMTHVGCLHRTCALFGDQKMGGGVQWENLDGRGIRAKLREMGGHEGHRAIDEIEWYMPGMAFHGREFMGGVLHGLWFWWVPRDAGSFTAWFIASVDKSCASRRVARKVESRIRNGMQSDRFPGLACFIGGDAPMQMSQGRVVRWDRENAIRGDRAVIASRELLKAAHKAEIEARQAKGLDGLVHRIQRPVGEEQVIQIIRQQTA